MRVVAAIACLVLCACGGSDNNTNTTDAKLHQYVGQYCTTASDCGGVLDCINVTCTENCGTGNSCPGTLVCGSDGTCHGS